MMYKINFYKLRLPTVALSPINEGVKFERDCWKNNDFIMRKSPRLVNFYESRPPRGVNVLGICLKILSGLGLSPINVGVKSERDCFKNYNFIARKPPHLVNFHKSRPPTVSFLGGFVSKSNQVWSLAPLIQV